MTTTREIRLKSRPVGLPQPEHFELATVELPKPGAGEVLNLQVRVEQLEREVAQLQATVQRLCTELGLSQD